MAVVPLTKNRTQCFVLSTLLILGGTLSASDDDAARGFLGRSSEEWRARLESHEPAQRAEAAWALAQYVERNPQLNESTRLVMLDNSVFHRDATVRYWMIHGLQRLALAKETHALTREAMRLSLQKSLEDKETAPRIVAAETLGLTGDAEAALPVLIAAMSDPQDAVRIQAVAALEKLAEAARPAEATLRAATSDSSEYVKRISTRALLKLDPPKQ